MEIEMIYWTKAHTAYLSSGPQQNRLPSHPPA